MSRIAIVFTGGTIVSAPDVEWGGVVPSVSAFDILERVPGLSSSPSIEVVEFGMYPGPHVTIPLMLELSNVVRTLVDREDISGVVVTHGTDTLEETAFFLDLTIDNPKPIVVLGAMRNSSEADWDGPRNLSDAVRTALDPSARGLGVLVLLGGLIHAASEVQKIDTEDLATFHSFDFGPLGRISQSHMLIYRQPAHRDTYSPTSMPNFVPLLKCYAGMDSRMFDYCLESGAEGIVIEAFGVGNVPPAVFPAIKRILEARRPVVLVSRCPVGRIAHTYAYEGAGKHLHHAGVIFADYLTGQKARIKLIVQIGAGRDIEQMRGSFEWVSQSLRRLLQ